MNKIKIDTSNNLITHVDLSKQGKLFLVEEKRKAPGDQNVLLLIEKLLKKHNLALNEIDNIDVETGPGSYTGLRVGAAIANAFSFGLNVSVNGKKIGESVEPVY